MFKEQFNIWVGTTQVVIGIIVFLKKQQKLNNLVFMYPQLTEMLATMMPILKKDWHYLAFY